MPRPPKCRKIAFLPHVVFFKPAGIPTTELEEVVLALDEMEALRLADLEGLYQEEAAGRMNVSRQTFANILASAHEKTAEALLYGKALRIEGGVIEMKERPFICMDCSHAWSIPSDSGPPEQCPECGMLNIRQRRCAGKKGTARDGSGKRKPG